MSASYDFDFDCVNGKIFLIAPNTDSVVAVFTRGQDGGWEFTVRRVEYWGRVAAWRRRVLPGLTAELDALVV